MGGRALCACAVCDHQLGQQGRGEAGWEEVDGQGREEVAVVQQAGGEEETEVEGHCDGEGDDGRRAGAAAPAGPKGPPAGSGAVADPAGLR